MKARWTQEGPGENFSLFWQKNHRNPHIFIARVIRQDHQDFRCAVELVPIDIKIGFYTQEEQYKVLG